MHQSSIFYNFIGLKWSMTKGLVISLSLHWIWILFTAQCLYTERNVHSAYIVKKCINCCLYLFPMHCSSRQVYAQNKALVTDCFWPLSLPVWSTASSHFVMCKTVGYIREHTCQHSFCLEPWLTWPSFQHQTHNPFPCKSSIFSLSSLPLVFLHDLKWGSPLQNGQLFQSIEFGYESFFVTVSVTLHHVHIDFYDLSFACIVVCDRTGTWYLKSPKIRCMAVWGLVMDLINNIFKADRSVLILLDM